MRKTFTLILFLIFFLCGKRVFSQVAQVNPNVDTTRNNFGLKEKSFLGIRQPFNSFSPLPDNFKREVEFDAVNKRYIIREVIGGRFFSPPQYLTIEEYQRLINSEIKRNNWRVISDADADQIRNTGIIPTMTVDNSSFVRIFGSNTINIQPRGEAELTLLGRVNTNNNPLFNDQQRSQSNFDFNQRIQMDVVGNIGTNLKVNMNYNTEAQFDFENQIKLDYTGKEDDIIKKLEVGNVSLPLNTTLIQGTQALFGVKTQLQFGKLNVTTIISQQKSQTKELKINNGAQQNTYRITGDNYEANKHYFLARYFRDNYNKNLATPPTVFSGVNITKVEVWITNKTGNTTDSRDVLGLIDLGENIPYNTAQVTGGGGYSTLPSGFVLRGSKQSNNLLSKLPANARLTNSNDVLSYFQSNGSTDNFAKLTYARKLTDKEYTYHSQLGYISLNNALNSDEVLAVAYQYTYNGVQYQVGEFSTDINFDATTPKVLFVKLLKNETIKTNLPTWNLMMKNIYSIGGYQISPQNFKLDITRLNNDTGTESPVMTEGVKTANKLWINLTGLDRLDPQNERKPDGIFDYEVQDQAFSGITSTSTSTAVGTTAAATNGITAAGVISNSNTGYITIDPLNGRIIFPVIEPFGKDLAAQFNSSEQALVDKYTFTALYDSTKVIAQQLFLKQNRYVLTGTYQSNVSSVFSLNSINVPQGSVKVFSGTIPLQEGVDFTVDYQGGRVTIINQAILISGQPIRITTEDSEMFGLQQKSLFGARADYRVSNKLNIGGTFLNLSEKPLTTKVNVGDEPVNNSIWGLDMNYNSPSRFLTKMVDKLPFISTKAPSKVTFSAEFAKLIPGHSSAINSEGDKGGVSYLDDFESASAVIDLKSAISWQLSGTPQLFSEANLSNDLSYGYNRAKIAFYNIDPTFYNTSSSDFPSSLRNNKTELSNHYVREIIEQEVFPLLQTPAGQAVALPTLNVAFYPTVRGPYNYSITGFNSGGDLQNPKSRWGGIFRKIDTNDFESLNIEYIELWVMDPYIYKPNSLGGDLYFNLGNISEDILKDGRKSLENGLPATEDPTQYDETNWGRVPKLQPVVQAFDNDPAARQAQDVGLDGLSDADEKTKFAPIVNQIKTQLNATAAAKITNDPSSDDYVYYRGPALDQASAGILKRYENYNGTEGNSKTSQQSTAAIGIDNSASTSLPDGEDVNRDNNMTQSDEYFQYKVSMRKADLVVGKNYVTDAVTTQVKLANGQTTPVTWYQIRIPISDYQQKVGDIEDFKSIRFFRMFLTNYADTTVLRFGKIQLVRGEWRKYNTDNIGTEVITDPALVTVTPDNSTVDVSTVSLNENGQRSPIPYVVPPGIVQDVDYTNYKTDTKLNEQSLALTINALRDGYGRAAFKTTLSDFRSYKRLKMFVHLEALSGSTLNNGDLSAFLRVGSDYQDNYYEYTLPLTVTLPNTKDPYKIWPDANVMDVQLSIFTNAKLARNRAKGSNGQAWDITKPFTYTEGGQKVIIKGQPDLGQVKVYMLGVRNPLKTSATLNDDGLMKNAMVWFDELRLTEYDDRGGWAATARLNAKLADLGEVNASGSKSTIGFGALDSKVSDRNRDDNLLFDVSTNLELGKFFPKKSGLRIPMYISYSSQVSTPEYDPMMPDVELKTVLATATKAEQKDILNYSQDVTTRNSINFTNVHKERTDPTKKAEVWDIENWNATYSYTNYLHHDFINQSTIQKTYHGSLAYNYSSPAKVYRPFDKIIKSNLLTILKDINFSLMPTAINFRMDVDRVSSSNSLRNPDPEDNTPISTSYSKNFLITRVYGLSWNLTKSMTIDFDATNYSIVDEPQGRTNALQRDTIWQNLKRLGRTTDYNHNLNITYNLPINKIPGLDWINVATRYGTNFDWQAQPLATALDPTTNVGNTIQNSRTVQFNPTLNFAGLYNKFDGLRDIRNDNSFSGILLNLLTSIKNVNVAYTQTRGIYLPGYLPTTSYLGISGANGAPGLGFVFGSQADIRQDAINSGWITTDTLQTQLYVNTVKSDLSFTSVLEPFKDFRITLTANKNSTMNYTSNFRYDAGTRSFLNLSPSTTGDYSISYITIGTAFTDKSGAAVSKLFNQFMDNRSIISQRLGAGNVNSKGVTDGYADGYNQNSQDVIISAFLAAYSGKSASAISLNAFPKIPLPNWRINYGGLSRLDFLSDTFNSIDLRHSYRSIYSINGFNSQLGYAQTDGAVSSRDDNQNFLPFYQYTQVTIAEQFSPLIGIDARLKNNVTANLELDKTRLMGLSLANSQLAMLSENNIVFGIGYRTAKFRFPFGLFKQVKMDNNLDFKLDFSIRDNETVIYRADVAQAEISSGAKNITYRPTINYVLNKQFNLKIFYDANITKPYTSQTYTTSYSSFGFSLRITFN